MTVDDIKNEIQSRIAAFENEWRMILDSPDLLKDLEWRLSDIRTHLALLYDLRRWMRMEAHRKEESK